MEGRLIKVCNVLLPGEICHIALLTLTFCLEEASVKHGEDFRLFGLLFVAEGKALGLE